MGLADELQAAHISVKCDYCLAEPGEKCTSPKGKPLAKPHSDRIKEGTEMWHNEQLAKN